MSKNNKSKKGQMNQEINSENQFSEAVEKKFKLLLKIMSWVVGISFVMIIILPELNNKTLDSITRVLYYIGIITLLSFLVIEFVSDSVKSIISRFMSEDDNAKSSDH